MPGAETRVRPSWLLFGPAFVAAIAYVDPGNVAGNVSAGAQFGNAPSVGERQKLLASDERVLVNEDIGECLSQGIN